MKVYIAAALVFISCDCYSQTEVLKKFYFMRLCTTEAGIRSEPKMNVAIWSICKIDEDLVWIHDYTTGLGKPNGRDVFAITNYEQQTDRVVYKCLFLLKDVQIPVTIGLYNQNSDSPSLILNFDNTLFEYFASPQGGK